MDIDSSLAAEMKMFLGVVSKFEDSLFKSFKSEHNSGTPFLLFFFLPLAMVWTQSESAKLDRKSVV